ncbi:MAG: ABC transporter ATP-binding protein [Deltaproteobacteria bacterium]|nr:ABC transporter ATP-binding protein [Deltaproteobacteria bacterium]
MTEKSPPHPNHSSPGRQNDRGCLVSVQGVGKTFRLYRNPKDRLKQSLLEMLPRGARYPKKEYAKEFKALEDISFQVGPGEVLGVIGPNGAGKTTLLQILAGVLSPTTGTVERFGRTSALLEIGSGFDPEFSGRENIYIHGAILGLSKKEMDNRMEEILDFAGIGEFADQPVKYYSSGMFVRLGFAIHACLEPEILLVDEVLAVGDVFFQQKCHARMEQLIRKGAAVVLVSHAMGLVEKYCTRTLLLHEGRGLYLGDTGTAVDRFFALNRPFSRETVIPDDPRAYSPASSGEKESVFLPGVPDWPAREVLLDLSQASITGETDWARLTAAALTDAHGRARNLFEVGEPAVFFLEFLVLKEIRVPVGGVGIINSANINVHTRSSLQCNTDAPARVRAGSRLRFRQWVRLDLEPGDYTFMTALASLSPGDRARAEKMDNASLIARHQVLLRARRLGAFTVTERGNGMARPFYGCAGLPGDCSLVVIQGEKEDDGGSC